MYHLPGNVIYATVGLVYINLQSEYELQSVASVNSMNFLQPPPPVGRWIPPSYTLRLLGDFGASVLTTAALELNLRDGSFDCGLICILQTGNIRNIPVPKL